MSVSNIDRSPYETPSETGKGGPPYDGDMEARLAKLEAIIPTLATKEDVTKLRGETRESVMDVRREVAELRGEVKSGFADARADLQKEAGSLHREITGSVRWFVGWVSGIGALLVSAAYLVAKYVH